MNAHPCHELERLRIAEQRLPGEALSVSAVLTVRHPRRLPPGRNALGFAPALHTIVRIPVSQE
jgi:hypothetical protein